MKNIVFVIESLHLGGAEKSLITLLQNLDYSKYKVDLITFNDGVLTSFLPTSVNYIKLDFPKLKGYDRVKYAFKRKTNTSFHHAQLLWPILKSYLKSCKKEYDVAIAYNQGFVTYFVADFISANTKFCWLNTDYKKAKYNISFDFSFYKKFSKVIAVSQEAKTSIEQTLETINQHVNIGIIKDITDEKMVRKQANSPLKTRFDPAVTNIVSVGRLVKYKGFHLAIGACQILVKKGYPINWYVVGEGNERENLEKKIKNAGLENHFFLLGIDTNPYPYMKACDIYVQTSLFEGLGLTVIEAALLHKPIVCTNFPTSKSLLTDEETGLIAEMNTDSIADKIHRLLDDKGLQQRLISNLQILENSDKEESLRKISELLAE